MTDAASAAPSEAPAARKPSALQRVVFLAITALCFVFLYFRLSGAAAREGLSLAVYMSQVFSHVDWVRWLFLMLAYSCFYFLVDTRVTTSALNWFLEKQIRYKDILPIRASAYIISILDERIGKGAIGYYLHRRDGVPGWQVGSSMLFIMFCEIYYLLSWATLGVALRGDRLPAVFHVIPWVALAAAHGHKDAAVFRDVLAKKCQGMLGIHWLTREVEEVAAYQGSAELTSDFTILVTAREGADLETIKQEVLLQAIREHCGRALPATATQMWRMQDTIKVRPNPRIADLIPAFLQNRRLDVTSLLNALDQGDFATVESLGHGMKGAGGSWGFDAITDIGAALERAAVVRDEEGARRGVGELSRYLDRVEVIA